MKPCLARVAAQIEERFNIARVRLVNDFVAAGYGLLTLDIDTECATVQVTWQCYCLYPRVVRGCLKPTLLVYLKYPSNSTSDSNGC